MRFCEQCGARFDGALACERCGYRRLGRPSPDRSAEPPPPPPGYAPPPPPAGRFQQPRPAASPATPAALARPGFPGPVIPPLVAALALIVTTAYATAYTLIEWDTLGSADVFFTAAAPSVFGAPFADYGSLGAWLDYGPFGGGWTIAIPLAVVVALTAVLASRTNVGAGARLAIGSLVSVPLALLTGVSILLADKLADSGFSYYGLPEMVLKAGGGAAIVGFLGGLLGGLLSLAIRPPLAVDVRHFDRAPGPGMRRSW